VVLGRSGRAGELDRPVLGDRCWVGPGAVLAGRVDVGDDAVVGANAVVTTSVPARGAAYGAPVRVLPERPSFDMVVYRGQETDPARAAALAGHRSLRPAAAVGAG
jgi:serine O-acetyltransferase